MTSVFLLLSLDGRGDRRGELQGLQRELDCLELQEFLVLSGNSYFCDALGCKKSKRRTVAHCCIPSPGSEVSQHCLAFCGYVSLLFVHVGYFVIGR